MNRRDCDDTDANAIDSNLAVGARGARHRGRSWLELAAALLADTEAEGLVIVQLRESPPHSLWPSPTLFKATAGNGGTPGEILARLNAEICRDNESCIFVTFFCAILDIRTRQVDYINRGHNLLYYLRHSGVTPLENRGGRALGVVEQSAYISGRMVLNPGEALLLYTDGVTEAMDSRERLYPDHRFAEFLASNHDSSPRQIVGDLVSDVRHFAGAAPQSDGITAMTLRYFWDDSEHE